MDHRIDTYGSQFRKFNRFYTNILGFLNQHIYDSPFSLTETRILYEIYNTNHCTATVLRESLGIDRGYLSRILNRFEKEDIIYKKKCEKDGRNHFIHLTALGKTIYKKLEEKANRQVIQILEQLGDHDREKLAESMIAIQSILSQSLQPKETVFSIRDYYIPQDIKTMIAKQKSVFAKEYGFDESFSSYLQETFKQPIEKVWIAESDGKFAGCVGLVKHDDQTVQLSWFLVEPAFRSQGVGTELLQSLVDYCLDQRYKRIFLWTVNDLTPAHHVYKKFGFRITKEKQEAWLWGQNRIEQRWDLDL